MILVGSCTKCVTGVLPPQNSIQSECLINPFNTLSHIQLYQGTRVHKMIPAESQKIPTESRKGVLKYVLLFLLTEETKSTHTEKGHHTHIVQWRRAPCFYHAAILRFVISATAKPLARLKIFFHHLLSHEQASKYFSITC